MNPYLIYVKLGAAAVLLAIVAGAGYHFGGMASRIAAGAQHAAQLQAVVKAMDDNARQAAADHLHMQGVIDRYDAIKDSPDLAFVAAGTAHRLYIRAASACGGGVPEATSVASGTQTPTAQPLGPSRVESALGDYIRACSADAAQMIPMIELAP